MTRTAPVLAALVAVVLAGCTSEALRAAPDQEQEPADVPAAPRPSSVKEYPPGPYGRAAGATIANLSFLGWRDPRAANFDPQHLEKVELADFYNPDGSKSDVDFIVLNASAVWCSVCRSEYRHIINADIYGTYRPRGLEILGVLFEDVNYDPAKPSDLVVWGGPDGFDLPFGLVLDPAFKTGAYFGSDATPMNLLIDAHTMRIIEVTMGYSGTYFDRVATRLRP